MVTYFTGLIISYILGYVYVNYINKDLKDGDEVLTLIIMTLFSWLGVAMTVMGTLTIIVNKMNEKDMKDV